MTGRMLDVCGDPLESAQVQALRLPKSGQGQPQMRGTTISNDSGEASSQLRSRAVPVPRDAAATSHVWTGTGSCGRRAPTGTGPDVLSRRPVDRYRPADRCGTRRVGHGRRHSAGCGDDCAGDGHTP